MKTEWIKCTDRMPKPYRAVPTKIDDGCVCREPHLLQCGEDRFWYTIGLVIPVYYKPTHWREMGEA